VRPWLSVNAALRPEIGNFCSLALKGPGDWPPTKIQKGGAESVYFRLGKRCATQAVEVFVLQEVEVEVEGLIVVVDATRPIFFGESFTLLRIVNFWYN
jgi:hypothetical protein